MVASPDMARNVGVEGVSWHEESLFVGLMMVDGSCGRTEGGVLRAEANCEVLWSSSQLVLGAYAREVAGQVVLDYAFVGFGRRSTSSSLRCHFVL